MTFQEINDRIIALAAQKGGQGVSFKFAFPTVTPPRTLPCPSINFVAE